MRTREENNIDTYFRKNLSVDHTSEMDADWQLLKVRLQREKKRDKGILPYILSGIAALLLLFLSFLFFNPGVEKPGKKLGSTKKSQQNTDSTRGTIDEPPQGGAQAGAESEESRYTRIQDGNAPVYQKKNRVDNNVARVIKQDVQYGAAATTPIRVAPAPAISESQDQVVTGQQQSLANVPEQPIQPAQQQTTPSDPVQKDRKNRSRPLTSLAFSIAPDVNGVNSFKNSEIGVTVGAALTHNISKSFSITAGINYAQKVYNTEFSNYKPASSYQFPVKPINVGANCAVLDIPVGLNYTLFDKGNDRFSLGAGVSSYIMLNEKYNFTYQSAYTRSPRRYRVDNENQHILGVANLSASYERKLPNGTRLGINPYIKLPLTDIGYGNVRLRSAGVALSLAVDLNKK